MHRERTIELEAALYVVATPIGNLDDITLRALQVLAAADVIAAEDTRHTRHLLQHHGMTDARLLALHQHNERGGAERIIELLQGGSSVALVSDAGTPTVSDPGAVLVRQVRAAGCRVIPIPGPSAALAALSASGLTDPHFLFYGFLPNRSAARRAVLQSLADFSHTLVFYEAPHRILDCCDDLLAVFGPEREIVFARELTKLFEQIHGCSLGDARAWLEQNANHRRGEFVLLVAGAPMRTALSAAAEHTLTALLAELPLNQAVRLASEISGGNRNVLYRRALEIRDAATDK